MRDPNRSASQLVKNSTEVRRMQQYTVLKKWDLGKITANQCIENILDLEKVIYIGDNFRAQPQQGETK